MIAEPVLDAYRIYLVTTAIFIAAFSATAYLQFRKYREKKIRLHFWAGTAFVMLLAQEAIIGFWVFSTVFLGISPASRPWYLDALAIFFSLTLLGLAMTGRIND